MSDVVERLRDGWQVCNPERLVTDAADCIEALRKERSKKK